MKRGYSRAFTARGDTGKRYLLGDIPAGLWTAARTRARREGFSMRAAILHLLTQYVDGDVAIATTTNDTTDQQS